jgi:MFS family permease
MKSYAFYKWRTWLILAVSFIFSLFHRSALGVLSNEVAQDLSLNASHLAHLTSVTFYTYALMQIPAGLLLDYFGYKGISCIGITLTGLGSVLFSLAHHLSIAYLGRFLIGLGTSVIFISILKAQHIWFEEKAFTKASGLLSFIGNLGGVIATFPLALCAKSIGWRFTLGIMGILCVMLGAIIFFFVKNSPAAYHFTPQGKITTSNSPALRHSLKNVFLNPATWRNFFVLFTLVGSTTALTGLWGINYLTKVYQISTTKASFFISFIIYGLVVGSLFVNKIIKHLQNQLMLYPRIACCLISLCWFYFLIIAKGKPTLPLLAVLFFIMGFLAMSHIVGFTDIILTTSPAFSGLASSVVNAGEFLGSSVISLFIGGFLDFFWQGATEAGVRVYPTSHYIYAFYGFFFLSLIGIGVTFIGEKNMKFPQLVLKRKSL